jgi:hypothetical protein
MSRSGGPQPVFLRTFLLWTAGFLAFPLAGVAGGAAGDSTRAGGYRPPRSA